MASKTRVEIINSEINKLTLEIDNKKRGLLIQSNNAGFDKSIIENDISILENKKWKLNNELNSLIIYKSLEPNTNSINNPCNYVFHKTSIKCKLCDSEGDEIYVFHTTDCKFKHQLTSVKYVLGIM
ncbi:MAG: hypothetical protein E6R13_01970 [Spirochaetes bacterium]|nr:MAG: hypothetical protein E6R13_01970 [Spirochaetota bacterium]